MKKIIRKAHNSNSLKNIQRKILKTQIILIVTLALFLGTTGIFLNFYFETQKRDRNLQNVAETIARSPILFEYEEGSSNNSTLREYLDSLKNSLSDIDVISVVSENNVRIYHSNHELISTVYDGTIPNFLKDEKEYYAANDQGPSGTQRRAYAAVYDENGNYCGFVMAVTLMKNIRQQAIGTALMFLVITLFAVLIELLVSTRLSSSIKKSLLGYEPDVFSAMYQIRDNILESLDEGIVAIDSNATVQFINGVAAKLLFENEKAEKIVGKKLDGICNSDFLIHTLQSGEKQFNVQDTTISNEDVLIDKIPVKQNGEVIGAIGILHNRSEYTKLMEDLTGTRYLVDSMRANNHDFTNKLHVILGLIQMEMYDEAISYIENITIVQRQMISQIMKAVDEPSVAALLIGKLARASELNIKFVLREGSSYRKNMYELPGEVLVTVIGNLIDNAFDSMNQSDEKYDGEKELLFGIYSRSGAVLITTDDTGCGIAKADVEHIFDNGFSTKGDGRGTGLYQVKTLVDGLGGTISVESQEGVGTSFSVSFMKKKEGNN